MYLYEIDLLTKHLPFKCIAGYDLSQIIHNINLELISCKPYQTYGMVRDC
jgi:hypothetical protein